MANEDTQAEVGSNAQLGPLPERFDVVTRSTGPVPVWNAEQMRAYAAECVAAQREWQHKELETARMALEAENAALKRDLQYARDLLTKGRTTMRDVLASLRAALVKVLDTRDREARATMSYQTARENGSGSAHERQAYERAMLAASDAEREARVLLLTLRDEA
jgi:hypothetical protein